MRAAKTCSYQNMVILKKKNQPNSHCEKTNYKNTADI